MNRWPCAHRHPRRIKTRPACHIARRLGRDSVASPGRCAVNPLVCQRRAPHNYCLNDSALSADSDPEGAITATRTLLESTCKHICDERGVSYENNWDLTRLYKATAGAMEIAPDQHSEQVIKQILSGVSTVVTGIGSLRNSLSDAHGRGKRAVRPAPRHAKLAVNAGFAVAGFLIDTHIERPSPTVPS